MMEWDQTISLGRDRMCIIKIGLSIGWMSGLGWDAFRASIGRGLDYFVYKLR